MNDLLARRRDRAIAIILRIKEAECDAYLPPEISARLRKVILDQLNDLSEVASDLLRATEVNDLYLEKFDAILEAVNGKD